MCQGSAAPAVIYGEGARRILALSRGATAPGETARPADSHQRVQEECGGHARN
jgi:hypothetical protein